MNYMGNSQFWDEKFESRSNKVLNPEHSIVQRLDLLKPGSVLDIACGDGRNALHLLKKGFYVTGLDFSQAAIKRVNHFTSEYADRFKSLQVDLTKDGYFTGLGTFDNAIICHYRLMSTQLLSLAEHIKVGGIILITGFGHLHKCDKKIGENDLIYKSDIDVLLKDFRLIDYNEQQDDRGFLVTYVLEKKEN